jgi:hypothetical protein
MESKSFEFWSKVSKGVRLAERSRGIFRAVILGWPSLFWLMHELEVFIKGQDIRENCRTYPFFFLPKPSNSKPTRSTQRYDT